MFAHKIFAWCVPCSEHTECVCVCMQKIRGTRAHCVHTHTHDTRVHMHGTEAYIVASATTDTRRQVLSARTHCCGSCGRLCGGPIRECSLQKIHSQRSFAQHLQIKRANACGNCRIESVELSECRAGVKASQRAHACIHSTHTSGEYVREHSLQDDSFVVFVFSSSLLVS